MATFNWSPNPYFTPNAYVSPHGSDSNDGSESAPYRTIQKAKDMARVNVQLGAGVYRELYVGSIDMRIYGDGGVIFDYFPVSVDINGSPKYYNIYVLGRGKLGLASRSYYSCFVVNNFSAAKVGIPVEKNIFLSTVLNSSAVIPIVGANVSVQNTFIKQVISCSITTGLYPNGFNRNICVDCDIRIPSLPTDGMACDFNLYHNCTYRFGNDASSYTIAQIEATYGGVGIAALRNYLTAKLGSANMLNYSRVADPLFNNAALNDFTLSPLSPARHLAYDGIFVGALDVGFPTYAYANDLGQPNAFYNASKNVNTLVANNSITLVRNTDGSAQGSGAITEKPKDLLRIYELRGNQSSFMFADRNREMLDANADTDLSAPIAVGTPLTAGVIYVNENGAVVYNSITYSNRSRITAVDSVQSFTSVEGAVLYAITEYPNRYTNLARFKNAIAGTQIAAGTNVLTEGSWYRVLSDVITWNGLTVPVGDSFQAVAGQLSFSGSGVVVEEFNNSDVWAEFIINAPMKCRRVGNTLAGVIDNGTDGKPLTNGHKEYYSAANKARAEFSVYGRYVQKHWVLNTKMSK